MNNPNYFFQNQVENFTRRFHQPPAVLLSAHRARSLPTALTDQNIVTWVKVILEHNI